MDENRLERIEKKLDQVLEGHSNRLTKLETEAGFIKSGLTLALAVVVGACTWAFRKVFG